MSKYKKHTSSLLLTKYSIVAIICLLLFSNCSKSEYEAETGGNTSSHTLRIRVGGIAAAMQDARSDMPQSRASVVRASKLEASTVDINSIKINTSFEIGHYGDEKNLESAQQQMESSGALRANIQSTSPIGKDITYRFILFQKVGSDYIYTGHRDATATASYTETTFDLYQGQTYKWVAYSYNSTDPIQDVISENSLSVETSIDRDFLYDSQEITIPLDIAETGQILSIDIIFKHRLARIGITLNARGFPAIIRNSGDNGNILSVQLASESRNYFKRGSLDLLNNSISNVESVSWEGELPFMPPVNQTLGDSTRVAYFYTADFENRLDNIQLSINYLMLQDIYTYRTGEYPEIVNQVIVVNARSESPLAGYSYNPTVNFLNTDGIRKGNLLWARGNLTFNPSTGEYSINKTPFKDPVSMINDYWMYNSLTPWDPDITSRDPQEAPVWDVSKDPCRQVPGGWRLPTSSEFLLLGGREFTEERDRLQSPNWDNDANVTVIGKGPYLDVKDNSYTSFRGDDGQWVTFFKTASLDPRSYNNRLDYERWVLRLADSGMFMVSDGGRGISYTSIQIDGEQDYCKTNSRARDRMISIRCVKDIVP